ncbi:hypothetical protein HDE_00733 [Halotydeus destructor]|nr:hypothetical protein HDE_00733 [Halotydeus destructor]
MDTKTCFVYVDFLLLLIGVKFFSRSRFVFVIKIVFFTLSAVYVLNRFEIAWDLLHDPKSSILQCFRYFTYGSFYATCMVLLLLRKRRIIRLLRTIISLCTEEEKKYLKSKSGYALVMYLIAMPAFLTLNWLLFQDMKEYKDMMAAIENNAVQFDLTLFRFSYLFLVRILIYPVSGVNWILIGASLHSFVLTSIKIVNQRLHSTFDIDKITPECYVQFIVYKTQLISMMYEFNDAFSFAPLAWYTSLFINVSCGLVIYVKAGMTFRNIFRLILFLYELLIVIIDLYLADKCQASWRSLNRQLTLSLSNVHERISFNRGLHGQVQRVLEEKMKISACGLFTLDKRLLLSFVSSTITFTVMFVQLEHEYAR